MKRECILLTLLPLFSYANQHSDNSYEESWSDQEQEDYALIAQNSEMQMQSSNGQMQNPDFQLYVQDTGFFIGADYLYWTVREGSSLEYAFIKDFPSYLPTAGMSAGSGLAGKSKMAKLNWNSGFRVNAGFQMGHDYWALLAEYTYFHTTGSDTAKRPNSSAIQPGTNPPDPIDLLLPVFPSELFENVAEMKSRIRFTENVLDLKLEKYFSASRFLSLGFAVGYEGAWLAQHWKLKTIAFPIPVSTKNRQNWHFSGAGPLLRLDSNWYITKNFTFFLDGQVAALYGYHKNRIITRPQTGLVFDTFQDATATDHRIIGHTTLEIGFSWDYIFKPYFINISAAYEINSWFNVNEIYHFFNNGNVNPGSDLAYSIERAPVSTHGLTLGFELHF